MRIVDSPLFQRLRRVHQLALTKFVYPSAENSRFVHSLGVVHSATAMFAAVVNNEKTDNKVIKALTEREKITYATILRFAALLHDIGHIPFSHAAEEVYLDDFGHEEISCCIIENYPPIKDVLESIEIRPKTVASLLTSEFRPKYRLLHEIISGQLDADRADYLLRDSHCCGVKYGEYDAARYASMFAATGDQDSFRLVIDEKDVYVAESFLIARYHYNMQVPFHRTRMGYDIALEMFLKNYEQRKISLWFSKDANNKLVDLDFNEFEYFDDNYLIERFKAQVRNGDFWSECLLRRNHLKLIVDETNNHENGEDVFNYYFERLQKAGYREGVDFFKKTVQVDILKSLRLSENEVQNCSIDADLDDPNSILVRRHTYGIYQALTTDIRRVSWIFKHFVEKPPMIYRIYVAPEGIQEIVKDCFSANQGVQNV